VRRTAWWSSQDSNQQPNDYGRWMAYRAQRVRTPASIANMLTTGCIEQASDTSRTTSPPGILSACLGREQPAGLAYGF
jgi:hypothetical protein